MYGMRGHIGVGKEAAWGVAVAVTDYIEAMSENINTTLERFDTKNIIGGSYEPDDSAKLQRNAGQIVVPAHPQTIGHLIGGAFGVNSITTVLSGVLYNNSFRPNIANDVSTLAPLDGYTVEINRDVTSAFQYSGVQFTSIAFAVGINQALQVTAGIIAKEMQPIAKTTPTFPTSPVEVFTFDTASLSIGGVGIDRIEALTISMDNQLEGVPSLNNSTTIAKVRRNAAPQVRVTGTLEFQDWTDFDNFRNQTEQRLTLNLTKADSFAILIDVPRMVFSEMPINLGGRGRVTGNFTAIGRYKTSSGYALRVDLTTVNTF